MPFTLATNLEDLYYAKAEKYHTPSTLALYKSYLNKLAKQGWDTAELLIKNQKKVLTYIKTLDPKYQKAAMNSLFYALSGHENNATNKGEYHKYFQELKKGDVRLQEYLKEKK